MAILILENDYNDLKKSRIPLGNFFMSKGYKVHYACPSPELKYINNIPMSRNSLAPYKLLKGFLVLIDLEVNLSIKKTLIYRFIPNVLNYLASFRNRKIKRVAVITGLGYAFIQTNNSYKSRIQRLFIKLFYKIASKRVQIVAQNPDDLIDLGVMNGKVILGSGVASDRKTIAKELHTDSIRLLFVSRLLKSKGILTTIDLFEKLKIKKPQTILTIAGKIDPENPKDQLTVLKALTPIAKEVRVEVYDVGKNKSVLADFAHKHMIDITFHGFVNDLEKVSFSNKSIAVLSSIKEEFGLSLLDTMSKGVVTFGSDVGGIREVLNNSELLFPIKQYNILTDLIKRVMNDSCFHNKMKFYCFKRSNKFSFEEMFFKYKQLYS